MYPTSRTWVNPRVRERSERLTLNNAREKICRKSPIWHKDFDLKAHNTEWAEGEKRRIAEQEKEKQQNELRRQQQGTEQPALRTAFAGKTFENNRGYVLGQQTVFCPSFEIGKDNVAPWPSRAEAKYEGDDRISTDALHRRFPGAPRVEALESVNWQLRDVVPQYPLDEFYFPIPQPVDIFLRTHRVEELEIDDEVGKEMLGEDLFEALDPKDQW